MLVHGLGGHAGVWWPLRGSADDYQNSRESLAHPATLLTTQKSCASLGLVK
jgi:hypothetical protein